LHFIQRGLAYTPYLEQVTSATEKAVLLTVTNNILCQRGSNAWNGLQQPGFGTVNIYPLRLTALDISTVLSAPGFSPPAA
jgi:hypothetical protein